MAQVSLNLLDFHQTSMHTAFEECRKDAKVTMLVMLVNCIRFCIRINFKSSQASAFDVHEIYYWYFSLCISKELKVGVCGSQIVGLVPLEAMLMAADYYIEKENLFILSEDQKIRLVCLCLFYLRDNSF